MSLVISVTDFKARSMALLDEMEQQGEPITITRRERPVAVLIPAPKNACQSPADSWKGRAEIIGDIVNTDMADFWGVVNGEGFDN